MHIPFQHPYSGETYEFVFIVVCMLVSFAVAAFAFFLIYMSVLIRRSMFTCDDVPVWWETMESPNKYAILV
uniref:Uncharacterized protein n=1 Tax=Steinernema glaseri TaxID=37863 RepID=A0A1I7YBQ6_9BILA